MTVPNVTGETLAQGEADLSSKSLKPQPRAFYNSSAPNDTNVVRTNPPADTIVSPSSIVQVLVPTQPYDMISAAPSAQWTATSQVTPPSASLPPGQQNSSTGAVFVVTPTALEDGTMASQALETLPPPVQNGTITGTYTLPDSTISGEQFRADIGFRQGTPTGQAIAYQVIAIAGGTATVVSNGIQRSGRNQVPSIMADLPAGTTTVKLVVTTLDLTPAQDAIVWANPHIEEANAPRETARPAASAT